MKSNLPRDDINLQFCRGQLKLKKDMLTDMMLQGYNQTYLFLYIVLETIVAVDYAKVYLVRENG